MSRKEIALIILPVVGALALYGWQTYRMAQHMTARLAGQDATALGPPRRNKRQLWTKN